MGKRPSPGRPPNARPRCTRSRQQGGHGSRPCSAAVRAPARAGRGAGVAPSGPTGVARTRTPAALAGRRSRSSGGCSRAGYASTEPPDTAGAATSRSARATSPARAGRAPPRAAVDQTPAGSALAVAHGPTSPPPLDPRGRPRGRRCERSPLIPSTPAGRAPRRSCARRCRRRCRERSPLAPLRWGAAGLGGVGLDAPRHGREGTPSRTPLTRSVAGRSTRPAHLAAISHSPSPCSNVIATPTSGQHPFGGALIG